MAKLISADLTNKPCILQYTTTDGEKLFINQGKFGRGIVSHTYTNIGQIVFYGPITTIEDWVFDGCDNPPKPKSLWDDDSDKGWFPEGCDRLTSITIPDSVTKIERHAFEHCSNLRSITIPNSVVSIGNSAFWGCSSLTSITIPNGVTTIEENTFAHCSNLENITFSDSLSTIKYSAFWGCSSLTSITIPASVTNIEREVFKGCKSLNEFKGKFASTDGHCLVVDGVLKAFSIGGRILEYTIPNIVTVIGEYAFAWSEYLTSITIPCSVKSIEHSAFCGCSNLKNINISDCVTTIRESAFAFCNNLTDISFSQRVKVIEKEIFYGCKSLTSFVIPNNVTTIEDRAFEGCNMDTLICSSKIPPQIFQHSFGSFECLIVPEGYEEVYANSDWRIYLE